MKSKKSKAKATSRSGRRTVSNNAADTGSGTGGRPADGRAILLAVFFVSGFAGLAYELVWIRVLTVVFGKTNSAVTVVVAVYMAGLGLGSLYWGSMSSRYRNPLRVFSALQFGIGLSSLLVLGLLQQLPAFYVFIHHLFQATPASSMALIVVTSFLLMLVPTFLMGGTFPVISKHFVASDRAIGRGVGSLYAVNTAGGIIGAGLTGYLLIGGIGQVGTQLLAVGTSLAAGAVAWFLPAREPAGSNAEDSGTSARHGVRVLRYVLPLAALSGYCALAYEILATRALSIFLQNSTYTFTNILIVFLLGISIGSLLFTRFFADREDLLPVLAVSHAVIGFYAICVIAFLNDLPELLFPFQELMQGAPLTKMVLPGLLLSAVILLVPSIGMGINFPAFCRIYTVSAGQIARGVGRVYFANTLGSIAGPLVAGFVLIPLLGVSRGTLSVAVLCVLMSIPLFLLGERRRHARVYAAGMTLMVIAGVSLMIRSIRNPVIHPPSITRTRNSDDAILYYRETEAGTVLVREDRNTGIRSLYVNNSAACGVTYDALQVVKMLGHLPYMANPHARDALVIGFGIGVTASAVARHDVNRIDCVEICPGVKEAAVYFLKHNNNVLAHPRVSFIAGDGRNHLLLSRTKYDLISCDPIHPTLGCGNLYTREYFQLCRDHLKPNGIVSQYLPLQNLSPPEFKSLVATFHSVFPHSSVWLAHSHGVLMGSMKEIAYDFRFMQGYLNGLRDEMMDDPYRIAVSLMLDADAIKEFTRGAKLHTDDRPFLEYFTPRTIRKENWHLNLLEMLKYRVDPARAIRNIDDRERFDRYLEGQEYYLQALVSKNRGDDTAMIEHLVRASDVNPENKEIRLFLAHERRRVR